MFDYKKDRKVDVCIWIIFILITNFFGFYKYLPLGEKIYSVDYMLISCFLFSCILLLKKIITNHGKLVKGYFFSYGMVLLALVVLEAIVTFGQYRQPLVLTIKEAFYYFVPIVTYLAFCQIKRHVTVEKVCRILTKVSVIASSISILAFISYTYLGVNFLKLSTVGDESFRNGTIRFGVGGLIVYISVIVSMTRVLRKTYHNIDIYNIVLGLLQIIFVNKSRITILYFIVVFIVVAIREKKTNKFFKCFIVLIILIMGVWALNFLENISSEISTYIDEDASLFVRLEAIEFYMEQFKQKPILGMGLLSADQTANNWRLVSGYNTSHFYYREDVGAIGLLNKFGIVGVLWVICFLKKIWKRVSAEESEHSMICQNIIIFLIVTMISLSFMDYQRVMYIFILLFISEITVYDVCRRENQW